MSLWQEGNDISLAVQRLKEQELAFKKQKKQLEEQMEREAKKYGEQLRALELRLKEKEYTAAMNRSLAGRKPAAKKTTTAAAKPTAKATKRGRRKQPSSDEEDETSDEEEETDDDEDSEDDKKPPARPVRKTTTGKKTLALDDSSSKDDSSGDGGSSEEDDNNDDGDTSSGDDGGPDNKVHATAPKKTPVTAPKKAPAKKTPTAVPKKAPAVQPKIPPKPAETSSSDEDTPDDDTVVLDEENTIVELRPSQFTQPDEKEKESNGDGDGEDDEGGEDDNAGFKKNCTDECRYHWTHLRSNDEISYFNQPGKNYHGEKCKGCKKLAKTKNSTGPTTPVGRDKPAHVCIVPTCRFWVCNVCFAKYIMSNKPEVNWKLFDNTEENAPVTPEKIPTAEV